MAVTGREPVRVAVARLEPSALVAVAVGGAAGACARQLLSGADRAAGWWPLPTLAINVLGSLLLGALMAALAARAGVPPGYRARLVRLGLGTGVLGGFTTFSTFSVDVVRLLDGGRVGVALGYLVLTPVLAVAAAAFGFRVTERMLVGRRGARS